MDLIFENSESQCGKVSFFLEFLRDRHSDPISGLKIAEEAGYSAIVAELRKDRRV